MVPVNVTKPSKNVTGLISIFFVMLVWGSSFTVSKIVVSTVPPALLALLRFLIASAILTPFLLIRLRKTRLPRPFPYLWISMMGLTGITVYYICFHASLLYLQASTGAMIEGFMPVCIALFAAIFLKEKLSGRQVAGIVLSVAGVICIGMLAGNDAPGIISRGAC